MTLQDFVSTINETLVGFGQTFLPFFVPLFAAGLTILIGILLATLLTFVIHYFSDLLSIEKSLQKFPSYRNLEKLSKTYTLTGFTSRLIWIITVLIFLFAALQLAGFYEADKTLNLVSEFLPHLIAGSLVLLLGIILAYFSQILTIVVGTLGKFPATTFFSRCIAAVILTFSIYQSLLAFGLPSEMIRFLAIGLIVAGSLALGLGTKTTVSQTIRNIWNQKL